MRWLGRRGRPGARAAEEVRSSGKVVVGVWLGDRRPPAGHWGRPGAVAAEEVRSSGGGRRGRPDTVAAEECNPHTVSHTHPSPRRVQLLPLRRFDA
jgi:hypothetical protein